MWDDQLEAFVASLAIPDDRKRVVLDELRDHVASAREAGLEPELGDLEALRRSFEGVEAGFEVTRRSAIVRGLAASIAIAVVLDQIAFVAYGIVPALVALAIAALLAPPRWLDLLRANLRARTIPGVVGRGLPIGPAFLYGVIVSHVPFLIWIALILYRVVNGLTNFDTPMSAFAVFAAYYLIMAIEAVRAREHQVA